MNGQQTDSGAVDSAPGAGKPVTSAGAPADVRTPQSKQRSMKSGRSSPDEADAAAVEAGTVERTASEQVESKPPVQSESVADETPVDNAGSKAATAGDAATAGVNAPIAGMTGPAFSSTQLILGAGGILGLAGGGGGGGGGGSPAAAAPAPSPVFADAVTSGSGTPLSLPATRSASFIQSFQLTSDSVVNFAGQAVNKRFMTADTTPTLSFKAAQAGLSYVIDWGNGVVSRGVTTGTEQQVTVPQAYRNVDEYRVALLVSASGGATDFQTADLSVAQATSSQYVNGILYGTKIENAPLDNGKIPVYYSFVESPETATSRHIGFGFDANARAAFLRAFQSFEAVANLQFIEVNDAARADIKLNLVDATFFGSRDVYGAFLFPDFEKDPDVVAEARSLGNGFLPAGFNFAGQGFFNIQSQGWGDFAEGSLFYSVFIHELGHALGLAHPHDDAGLSLVFPEAVQNRLQTFANDFEFLALNGVDNDQPIFTVMSYDYGINEIDTRNESIQRPFAFRLERGNTSTPGSLDIAALQYLYGPVAARTGNDVYEISDGGGRTAPDRSNLAAIHDTGGIDTLVYNGSNRAYLSLLNADLNDRSVFLGGDISGVLRSDGTEGDIRVLSNGTVIENATGGSGNDVLIGNAVSNRLMGRGGNDSLFSTRGADTVDGGEGVDTLSANFLELPVDFADVGGSVTLTVFGSPNDLTRVSSVERFLLSSGNDQVTVDAAGLSRFASAASTVFMDGGAGFDQLSLRMSSQRIVLADYAAQLSNIEAVDLDNAPSTTLLLRAADLLRMVRQPNELSRTIGFASSGALEFLVDGGRDDMLILDRTDGWRFLRDTSIGGETYAILTTRAGGADLLLAANRLLSGDFAA